MIMMGLPPPYILLQSLCLVAVLEFPLPAAVLGILRLTAVWEIPTWLLWSEGCPSSAAAGQDSIHLG